MIPSWSAILVELGALAVVGDPGAYVAWCPVHRKLADLRGDQDAYATHWCCTPGLCEGVEDLIAVREWAARHLTRPTPSRSEQRIEPCPAGLHAH